jgi:hypothetical protein
MVAVDVMSPPLLMDKVHLPAVHSRLPASFSVWFTLTTLEHADPVHLIVPKRLAVSAAIVS